MENLILISILIAFVILGFLIAEFQNAYIGKQEKESKTYFSIIGVTFTQKDFQRLFFAISLGVGVMFILPLVVKYTGYEIDSNIIYIVIGYSPSTVMMFVKKRIQNKIK